MNVIRVILDKKWGHVLRVECNGVTLPLIPEAGSLDVTQDFTWAAQPWVVKFTLMPDDVQFVTESTIVDADPAPRALLEGPVG